MIARVAQWADADPVAMRLLLEDAELRAHLLRALNDLVGEVEEAKVREAK